MTVVALAVMVQLTVLPMVLQTVSTDGSTEVVQLTVADQLRVEMIEGFRWRS